MKIKGLIQRIRRRLGLPNTKRCCRKEGNLGPVLIYGRPELRLTYRKCNVCGARHFSAHAQPGKVGVRLG